MAGNIVKWWKHKILGGYKQFSVQECTTDSEELMYHQVRASSSCSAPPDLLLVSDRENNIPLRSPVVNIITTTTTANSTNAGGSSAQKHHQTQQQQHGTKDATSKQHAQQQQQQQHLKMSSKNGSSKLVTTQQQMSAISQQQHHQQQQQQDELDGVQHQPQQQQQQQSSYQRHSTHQQQHGKEERIRLEEFTCDVSVEGGKSSQPLQFSFTFYDLDGHHGKITKDDIVGIVYTIYESIGKSVVVPHCGSKTINVRLTVSPEGKSKAAAAAAAAAGAGGANGKLKKLATGLGGAGMLEPHAKAHGAATTSAGHAHGHGHGHVRRQHRYRPRKLIKSDDEDDDSNSEKEKEASLAATAAVTNAAVAATNAVGKSKSHASGKYNKMKIEQQQQQLWYQRQQEAGNIEQQQHMDMATTVMSANCQHDSLYENMTANLKCCTKEALVVKSAGAGVSGVGGVEECRSYDVTTTAGVTSAAGGHGRSPTDVYMKQASSRVKMLRKARKQKYQDHCLETRQRSLSVGSEACWYNRHALLQQQQQQQQQQLGKQQSQEQPPLGDVVDGVQLRNAHKTAAMSAMAQKRNSAECWKTALNRNDLISIIRESMEKNRLCFQMSGKPQANVSPIRQPQHQHQPPHSQSQQQQEQQQHRQRSNTVSKIPTLIANHSNSIINHSLISPNSNSNSNNINNNNNSNSINTTNQHNSNSSNNNDLNFHDNSNNSHNTSLYHPQPHIPIYHQQMAINPAVLAAQNGIIHGQHNKMNLCGYDSFLHATICGGGTSHSPPPTQMTPISNQPTSMAQQQQPIATVQPIMTALNAVPNLQSTPKVFVHSTTHQIKTSKILRSGSYSQQHAHHSATTQNSPQYHGYQRLSSSANASTAHHHHQNTQQQQQQQQQTSKLAALNLHNSTQGPSEKTPVEQLEKWLQAREKCQRNQRKDLKNYDNSLYAKLSEKLQESTLNAQAQVHNKENMQRRKHKSHKRAQNPATAERNTVNSSSSNASGVGSVAKHDYPYPLIPIHGDPTECQILLAPTTDDETSNEAPMLKITMPTVHNSENSKNVAPAGVQVATATLVDLNDATEEDVELGIVGAVNEHVDIDVDGVEDEEELDLEEEVDVETEGSGSTAGSAPTTAAAAATATATAGANVTNTSSAAASLIHRYVHEHIHHHYHHFEEKDE